MKPTGHTLAKCAALLMSASCMTPAMAQDQAQAGADDGDIVVTALRRDVNLQDVPAAVTAFTSESIENAGIERPSEFINLTSNVNLVETQNSGNAFIIIRGITQARNSEPSVAVVIDGVQQVNPAMFNRRILGQHQGWNRQWLGLASARRHQRTDCRGCEVPPFRLLP
jgi:iron complex outermembrane recepter protein